MRKAYLIRSDARKYDLIDSKSSSLLGAKAASPVKRAKIARLNFAPLVSGRAYVDPGCLECLSAAKANMSHSPR